MTSKTTSKLKNDIAPNNAGENSTKLPPASSRSVGEELTFEEEWKFGSRKGDDGGGGGGEGEETSSSKSSDLKADGDRITRRGVKRGPRKTKKTISIGTIKSARNDSTTTDSEQVEVEQSQELGSGKPKPKPKTGRQTKSKRPTKAEA